MKKVFSLLLLLVVSVASAWYCPGGHIDLQLLRDCTNCATYTEQIVWEPIVPSYGKSGKETMTGSFTNCSPTAGTANHEFSFSVQQGETISSGSSGTLADSVGATLQGGVKDILSIGITATDSQSTTTEYSASKSTVTTKSAKCSVDVPACTKSFVTMTNNFKYGDFSNGAKYSATVQTQSYCHYSYIWYVATVTGARTAGDGAGIKYLGYSCSNNSMRCTSEPCKKPMPIEPGIVY